MKFKKCLSVVTAMSMVTAILFTSTAVEAAGTGGSTSSSSSADVSADSSYQEGYNSCVNLESEGSVLLKNSDNCLPLKQGTKVTLLGSMSYNYVEGGTGSGGGKDDENTVMMNDAFTEAGLDVNTTAWNWLAAKCGGKRNDDATDPAGSTAANANSGETSGWASYTKIHEFPVSVYENGKSSICTSGYTDYAIVTLARSGAEGASPSMDYDGDGSTLTGTTYLELSQNEKDLLAFCKKNFKHTIVLINSSNAMELGFLDSSAYNIEACLWIGHPGEAGLVGVGTVLSGRTNPSGRLVDTYAYDMSTNPTYYNTDDNKYTNGQPFYQYEEGVYVGYRYYETADSVGYFDSNEFTAHAFKNGKASGYKQVVQFPFGYGLSYTNFTEKIASSDVKLKSHGTNSVTVKVTNTGSIAGKDVVELYMDAPYQSGTTDFGIKGRGLEKSKVVLIGFAKTDKIAAGKSADVTITFDTDDLASFDNFGQGCYALEKGQYSFNVQKDAHDWGKTGSDNAPSDTVKVALDKSIIYDNSGSVSSATYVGKRGSDQTIAKNSLDDVTAGDGNMLDGYLSRSNIAGGMASIMKHTSDEKPNEMLKADIAKCLALTGKSTYDYSFQTYIKGVKTTLSETVYAYGATMMPFATKTPDGVSVSTLPEQKWGQTYYVLEDSSGKTKKDSGGLPTVVSAKPTDGSKYHKLSCSDMNSVPITTETGKKIWDELVSEMTLKEAIEIQGNSGWKIEAASSVGKASQVCLDGPGEAGMGRYSGGTWFPSAVVIASTWNTALAKAEGVAYGHQDVLFGIGDCYGPAMNTHRSPFGGRNFEYYAEDGFLAGEIGGSAISCIQSTGTGGDIKHFALNDGDTNRSGCTTWADEQAVREVYLRPYEISVKDYGANGIMTSLNRVGLSWKNYGLDTTILHKEWGFNGSVITDGEGANGNYFNTSVAMLGGAEGSMLMVGVYMNTAANISAYGDVSATRYGQYALHEGMRGVLFQYCGNSKMGAVTTSGSPVVNTFWILVGVLAAIVVIAALLIVIFVLRRKKRRTA